MSMRSASLRHQHAARPLLRARDLADARFAEPLRVADLARAAQLSTAHFSRCFKEAFGESPHEYLLTRRLERAANMLRATELSVTEICLAVGWSSVGSFTTTFGRIYGRQPLAYRQRFNHEPPEPPIPRCVVTSYARPKNRRFREDDVRARS